MKLLTTFATLILLACTGVTPPPVAEPDGRVPEQYAHIPRPDDDPTLQAPKVIRRVEPIAPRELLIRRPLHTKVEAVINEEGRVEAVWFVSGDRQWGQYVAAALKNWVFEPATRDEKPVAVRFMLTTSLR